MRAPALCDLASDWLAARYPSSLIVRELCIGNWGSALVDIAAICEDEIVGIEIKGDGDSHARLERQGRVYSQVCTRMALLPAPSMEPSTHKHCPEGWLLLRLSAGAIKFPTYAWGLGDEHPWPRLATTPARLLETLWGRELKALAKARGYDVKGLTRVDQWVELLSENVCLAELRRSVCRTLRERDWPKFGRSGEAIKQGRYRWADGRKLSEAA